jgi:hypothetical protein
VTQTKLPPAIPARFSLQERNGDAQMKIILIILASALVAIAAGYAIVPTERLARVHSESYRSYVKFDRCLDWGGVFDEQTKQCTPTFKWFCHYRRSVWNERMLRCDPLPIENERSRTDPT